MVLFFAFYLLVLKKLTFFKFNRFYLLATLFLSFVIPSLQITVERVVEQVPIVLEEPVEFSATEIHSMEMDPHFVAAESTVAEVMSIDWLSLIPYAYIIVASLILLFGLKKLVLLLKHTKQKAIAVNGLKLVSKADGFTNCSFFNYVFINEQSLTKTELNILLQHESVHAKQYHSVDKILMMLAKSALWFNPVVYLWDKALEQVHEYEADEATSNNFGSKEYASLLLKLAVEQNRSPLVHNFVKSPVKERIKMLFNSKSTNMKKLMYLLVAPIVLGLIWGFTVKVIEVFPNETEQSDFVLVLDAGHGGKQKGAEVNGITEKELTLAIAQKVNAIAKSKGIKVVMTRNADEDVSFKERLGKEGAVLVSLHVNSEPTSKAEQSNGIEVFTAIGDEGNEKNRLTGKLASQMLKAFQNLNGIDAESNPKNKNLLLLRESKIPTVILELGYLTNKSDFQFITNKEKQQELAKSIIDAVIAYKNLPDLKTINNTTKDDKLIDGGITSELNRLTEKTGKELFGKTIKGKVKTILFTEVGEVLNFAYDKGVVRVFNPIKGKVKIGDELSMKVSGTVHNIIISDAKGNVIKNLDAPCITASEIRSSSGKLLYELKNEQKPFISKTSMLKGNDYREERITLNTYSGKILSTKMVFAGQTNKSAKIYTYVNGKLFNEQETLKFDKNFISKLSTNRGFSFANDFDIPEIKDKNEAVVFWFGEEPKLSFEKARRRKTAEIYNGKVVGGKVVDVTYNENKVMNGFIVKTSKEGLKANVEAKFATQIHKMIKIGDNVSIKIYNADYWRQMDMPILISYKLMKEGKLLFDRWPKQPAQALGANVYNEMPQSLDFNQQRIEKAKESLVSGPGKSGNLELSKEVSIAKMRYQASDSVKINRVFETMLLSGKAELDIEKYKAKGRVIHLDNLKKMVTVYLGSVKDENNLKIEADVIEIDLANSSYKTKNYLK